jgi:transposase
VFVFDGGMSSKLNLERMQAQDLHFITRISSSSLQSLVAQLPLDTQPQLWDRTELIELQVQERRYLIAGGSLRQYRDKERRQSRIKKALEALQKMASVPRKKVDAQKLASQAGRKLQSLKAHQYFRYWVDAQGQLRYEKNDSLIDSEQALDGLYLLLTSLEAAQCPGVKVLERYKNLQRVEEAFCQLKNYLELRPVFHWRADRVRNHLRLCFIAYWIVARLGFQWSQKGLKTEGVTLLRQLQQIRVGRLKIPKHQSSCLLTKVPPLLNALLHQLGLLQLFSHPPSWARL